MHNLYQQAMAFLFFLAVVFILKTSLQMAAKAVRLMKGKSLNDRIWDRLKTNDQKAAEAKRKLMNARLKGVKG